MGRNCECYDNIIGMPSDEGLRRQPPPGEEGGDFKVTSTEIS